MRHAAGPGVAVLPLSGTTRAGVPEVLAALSSTIAAARASLAERGRRLLRVHLPKDVESGLKTLSKAVEGALR